METHEKVTGAKTPDAELLGNVKETAGNVFATAVIPTDVLLLIDPLLPSIPMIKLPAGKLATVIVEDCPGLIVAGKKLTEAPPGILLADKFMGTL